MARQPTQDSPACGRQSPNSDPTHLTLHPVLGWSPAFPALTGEKPTLNDKQSSPHNTVASLPSFLCSKPYIV